MLLDDLPLTSTALAGAAPAGFPATAPAPPRPVDPSQYRSVLSHFASGVVVITGLEAGGQPVGMTAQSFTSLSLDPPLILVCPARTSTSWPRISGRRFAVNVLAAGQREVSAVFAQRGGDKFAKVDWHRGPNGLPLIAGAIAQLECDLESLHPGGDHLIAVGRVLTLAAGASPAGTSPATAPATAPAPEPAPLIFFRSHYWVAGPHPEDA
jgi:3-hydroxy-9,10-secoandrosta-1,3,5(10)-triene-9,17-dione monooxygenase reductase component